MPENPGGGGGTPGGGIEGEKGRNCDPGGINKAFADAEYQPRLYTESRRLQPLTWRWSFWRRRTVGHGDVIVTVDFFMRCRWRFGGHGNVIIGTWRNSMVNAPVKEIMIVLPASPSSSSLANSPVRSATG